MNIKPTGARIIIRPDPEHSNSQLVIPAAAQRMTNRGVVIAVGPGRRHIDGKVYPLESKVGQRVMFGKLRAYPFELDGDHLVMVDDEEVLCVLE